MSAQRLSEWWPLALAFVGFVLLPALDLLPTELLRLLASIGTTAISVMGLNLLLGYTGQVSLGQAAFVMVGAYTSAILARETGLSFWLSMPLAGLAAGLVGLLFGLPSLRVRGFYLAMATLAAQFIIPWVIKAPEKLATLVGWLTLGLVHPTWDSTLTGGATGLQVPAPVLFGSTLDSTRAEYLTVLAVVVVAFLFQRNVVRTRTGRALVAIRDNERAAEVLGIHPYTYKLQAFFLCALYAGIAGALQAHFRRSISPDAFTLASSIEQLGMLVVGGAGYLAGPLFGVSLFRLMQDIIVRVTPTLREIVPRLLPFVAQTDVDTSFRPLIFGLTLMLFLIYQPLGMAHGVRQLAARWRARVPSR
ncbi:MAG: branched-chain amino acid ABC transporter permease [Ardenticatenales bacterium]|nr:branched-chain amino acid ABC transporter permease [Ardenticatenales bacterium]